MRMPFGKYKDQDLSEIPKGYLSWLRNNCELREPLKSAIEAIVGGGTYVERRRPSRASDELTQTMEAIRLAMAMEFSPDLTGDVSTLRRINQILDDFS